jgi:cyanophycin synthetase
MAVLETARGGIVLRGVGYESNDASVLTNVSSDHLDLQGIHTLPELAEVKATVCRITRPDGWAVLNGDDPWVAGTARRIRANVAYFSLATPQPGVVRRHLSRGGRTYLVRDGHLAEVEGDAAHPIVAVSEVPITIGGLARHNVANALAAAGAARGMGASLEDVREGLVDFRPSSERSPGRLNLFRVGRHVVIVDFAHNEAGVTAVLDVARGIAERSGDGTAVTMIIGTAGDRPDDTLRGIGRIAARRADRIAVKETRHYLRGRSRESMIGELLSGVRAGGAATDGIPVYGTESEAVRGELAVDDGSAAQRVIVLMCHEERDEVFRLLSELGAAPVDVASELAALVPDPPGPGDR